LINDRPPNPQHGSGCGGQHSHLDQQ
jgi:hypothetical protein